MTPFRPDHPGAEVRPSPNFGPRRDGIRPDIIILHYTGMETGEAAEDWLCNPASEVSCHYLVHENGRIVQLVAESERAWHAGKSSWGGLDDINSRSIGIEIVNPGHAFGYVPFPAAQIEAVINLCLDVAGRHSILRERVLAHSDVAPGRKVDPGELFPWGELASRGVGHFVAPTPLREGEVLVPGTTGAAVASLQSKLALYGYGIESTGEYDPVTQAVVAAFQRHFRPDRVDGAADASTLETLDRLLDARSNQRARGPRFP